MAEISKITLPSGATYDLKDAYARQMIAGGINFVIAWNGTSAPTVANIPAGVVVVYNNTEYTGTLTASASTVGSFYLVKSSTPNGTLDIYDEYTTITTGASGSETYFWEKIGDTQVELDSLGELAFKDVVYISRGAGDNVLGEATTFTNASSAVTFSGGTTDTVLGSNATFTTTVTPTTTNIKATASGTAVGANGTAAAITGFGNHTTDTALGSGATFTTSVTPTTTNIKATASGTAVAANGTANAITGFGTHTTDTFVKSVSAETNKHLVVTSITPTNGTETVSKVTKTASKLVTTSIPNVTGNTNVSIPNVTANTDKTLSFAMGTGDNSETLVISGSGFSGNTYTASKTTLGTALSASKVTLGTAITAATGSVASNGSGSDIVTAVTVSDKTVAKAGTAVTVATGETDANGTGDAIVTGVTIGQSGAAITALGTPTTSACLTGVKVTTQPTISLATGATAGTGVISVATGIDSASTSVDSADTVTAITALGTPTTANCLTGVKVTTQPTVSLATGATAGTGVVSVATGITSATTTTNNKDQVTAITGIGTGTAAAQTITVGTNDKVKVAKYADIVGVDGLVVLDSDTMPE